MIKFSDLMGKTLTHIEGDVYSDELIFTCDDGKIYGMSHYQDCCERVQIEEIIGDLSDLLNTPIVEAEEVSYENEPDPEGRVRDDDLYQWTFYKLRTIKGNITIRWLGESNGYYSVGVNFYEVKKDNG